jgi:hypothetical protein
MSRSVDSEIEIAYCGSHFIIWIAKLFLFHLLCKIMPRNNDFRQAGITGRTRAGLVTSQSRKTLISIE